MSDRRRGFAQDEVEPPYDDGAPPKTLKVSRHIDDVFYVAGRSPVLGQEQYDVMFVTASVEDDEATNQAETKFGFRINQPAEYLKGSTGLIRDVALRAGIDMDTCYFTAVCKWLLPKARRAKPATKILKWGLPVLEDEIRRVKPKIIVCMGKPAYDMVSDQKIGFKDGHGCWFWSEDHQAHVYLMHAPFTLVTKPDFYETFRVDFKEIARRVDILRTGVIPNDQVNYEVLRNEQDLEDWIARIEDLANGCPESQGADEWPGIRSDDGCPLLAVDCEWHGRTHIDGQLRTIQFAWSERDAVVIEFRNEKNEWSFDHPDAPPDLPPDLSPPFPKNVEPSISKAIIENWADGDPPEGEEGWVRRDEHSWTRETPAPQLLETGDFFSRMIDKHSENADDCSPAEHVRRAMSRTDALVRAVRGRNESRHEVEAKAYKAVGAPLADMLSRINAKYIGHHYAADSPWMHHKLGITVYQRCEMDTEFAQQTCDESSELGLERGIGMKYTTLGRYDQALVMWKRKNKDLVKGGYGFVPSAILHPYGARDVIAPLRAYPLIRRQLEAQTLWDYYVNLFNPFVTDVFTDFTMLGLPVDVPMLDDLRVLFAFARDKLEVKLQRRIHEEAANKLQNRIVRELGFKALQNMKGDITRKDENAIAQKVKELLFAGGDSKGMSSWLSLLRHFVDSQKFNIRSPDQMRRWLFTVEGLEPIKSTNQKAAGLPSMAWDKVLELPPERQKVYTPAVDKQTLSILSEQLSALDQLLDLNAVGNIAKAFLKEASSHEDPETGDTTTEEHGLHSWLASDGRIHGQLSTTETGENFRRQTKASA